SAATFPLNIQFRPPVLWLYSVELFRRNSQTSWSPFCEPMFLDPFPFTIIRCNFPFKYTVPTACPMAV
ncbi:MAG: hypothetical protein ACK55Z_00420, partial [bacterium]